MMGSALNDAARPWVWAVLFCALCVLLQPTARAQAEPIYEQEPYDLLTLNQANDSVALKIFPLELPGRKVPDDPRPTDRLRIRLQSHPEQQYDVLWRDVEKLELFEQLIFSEAHRLADARRFDEAFDYFAFLWREYPALPGLRDSVEQFLVNNALLSFRAGQWEDALVQLSEVNRLHPDRPFLANALARVNDKLVEMYVTRQNYAAARQMLQRAASKEDNKPLRDLQRKWATQLAERAATKMAEARALHASGRLREALVASRQVLDIWPQLEGAAEFAEAVLREYPLVRVGVTQPAVVMDPRRLDNWPSRRAGRLRHRMLMELEKVGSEGGQYVCPIGSLRISEDARQLTLQLREFHNSDVPTDYTGFDVSRRLLNMADPAAPSFVAGWNQWMVGVAVSNVRDVIIDLALPHLRVEALMRATLGDVDDESSTPAADKSGPLNPYYVNTRTINRTSFLANPGYLLATPSQPQEIVEQVFTDTTQAIQALRRGQIDVLDRVFPADVPRLQQAANLTVEPYAIPSLHMLVANQKQPLLARRDFRRAILYGINRSIILNREILGGEPIAGCALISGPLPKGTADDDPLGYGYDTRIAPRAYEPMLAYILAQAAIQEVGKSAQDKGGEPLPDPSLVLVHPAAEVPRVACQLIAQQLSAIGLPCSLRELEPGRSRPRRDDWDLLYIEAWMSEPLTDAERLLGVAGPIHGGSAYLSQALHGLAKADNWKAARDRLLQVHRAAHEEVAVVPLWQIVDHFAYRRNLGGIGPRPATLYADVENWQILPSVARRD